MAKAQVRVLPSARNTVMVVDDQSTGRAILEQVIRSLDERVVVEGFARPVDAVVWATRNVSDLVLVDWSAREPSWADALRGSTARVILFGRHTDLEAHTEARAAGLGPMWARSKLITELPSLVVPDRT